MGPLRFEPYLRPQIWGGRNLERWGKNLPANGLFGESWELSDHPHHRSAAASGPLQGQTLQQILSTHGLEVMGRAVGGRFPLLIKLLDCQETLSIQVHPNDALAAALLGDEKGKTEAWVILESAPTGRIYAGLLPGVDEPTLRRHLSAGTTDQCLASFQPQPGDCVFIPAGTVHAVGGGVIMAEVQQTSDATFRLFDWNRVGADGKPRDLHIEPSLRAIDFAKGPVAPTKLPADPDWRRQPLVQCPYFSMERFRVVDALANPFPDRPSIWMALAGAVNCQTRAGSETLAAGQTILLPADCPDVCFRTATPAMLLGVTFSA